MPDSLEVIMAVYRMQLLAVRTHNILRRIERRIRRQVHHFELFNEAYLVVNPRQRGESLFDLRERVVAAFVAIIGAMDPAERRSHYRGLRAWRAGQRAVS